LHGAAAADDDDDNDCVDNVLLVGFFVVLVVRFLGSKLVSVLDRIAVSDNPTIVPSSKTENLNFLDLVKHTRPFWFIFCVRDRI
jgi:hypothetical protein